MVEQIQRRPTEPAERYSKRRRVTRACDICKSRKRRCTGDVPCTSCTSHGVECTYLSSYNRGKLIEPPPSGRPCVPTHQNHRDDFRDDLRDDALVSGSPIQLHLDAEGSPITKTGAFAGQYLGPSSPYSFLRRAWKRFGTKDHSTVESGDANDQNSGSKGGNIFQYGDRHTPNRDRINPSSTCTYNVQTVMSRYFELASPTYRFLHAPSVREWLNVLKIGSNSSVQLAQSQKAAAKLIIAIATLYGEEDDEDRSDSRENKPLSSYSESFYIGAKVDLDMERGRPSIVSVQAYLILCQYLLCTSRPSEAWYALGTTIQLIMALGMHRRQSRLGLESDNIVRECRKRVFWTACVLDTYLSTMLGRPQLIHGDDVNQDLPLVIDDAAIANFSNSTTALRNDCSMTAAVLHARLIIITKRVSKAQSHPPGRNDTSYLTSALRLSGQLSDWKDSLPVFLSGAVQPSTLMPVYRRQLIVLSLAHAHAVMLLGRPFLLSDNEKQTSTAQVIVDECLIAAKRCLDIMLEMAEQHRSFTGFWNTHYITFSALTVTYVWFIQRRNGRLSTSSVVKDEVAFLDLAELVRQHLDRITVDNAPSLRYNIILEELSQEASRWQSRPANVPAIGRQASGTNDATVSLLMGVEVNDGLADMPTSPSWDTSLYFPSDVDLWAQLDTFPFVESLSGEPFLS